MKNLLEIITSASEGYWFHDESPFRCTVQPGHSKLAVVTGSNMSGKSMARKILYAQHKFDHKIELIHMSQAARCAGGIGRAFMYGSEDDDSTGCNSIKALLGAIRTGQGRDKPFTLLFDEPEIGCSEELQAALGIRIARDLEVMPQMVGCIVITHSRQLAKQLLCLNPIHWRLDLDNLSLEQWTNRDVVPVDSLEDLNTIGLVRWKTIQKLINESKKNVK